MNFNKCYLCENEISKINIDILESGGFWIDPDHTGPGYRVCCSCCLSNINLTEDNIFRKAAEKVENQ
jgi:hypothetical protein